MQEAQAELICLRDESDAVKVVTLEKVGIEEAFNDSKVELAFPYCVPKHGGDHGSTVVKVLCYKSEGRWFDPSWCHWIFY
jgi:hypothetical protein